MKNRDKLHQAITKFQSEKHYKPEEIYVTKKFLDELAKELGEYCIFVLGQPTPITKSDAETKLIYCGVKIKEIKDFIITK